MSSLKNIATGIALGLLIPVQVGAYFTPEDVLLSKEFFLPPTTREASDRIERQVTNSADRRSREQELLFSQQEQYSNLQESITNDDDLFADELTQDESLKSAAPLLGGLDDSDLELLQTIKLLDAREQRLLDRVNTNQQYAAYYGAAPETLRPGAPNLAPTGAGGILSAVVMVCAVLWTIRRAKQSENLTQVLS